MGLESVEIILAWEESFGITLSEAEAAKLVTTRDAVTCIYAKLRAAEPSLPEDPGCMALRAYYRLKRSCVHHGIDFSRVRPDAKLADLVPRVNRRKRISAILSYAGFAPLPRMPFGLQFTSGRLRDYVLDCVISHHGTLRRPGTTWSREQVREVVRAILRAQLVATRFSDDARFVQDLGVD
jgi:hypothetical protein